MKKYYSNLETLRKYSAIFETLKTNTKLAQELAEYGYPNTQIAQGEILYNNASQLYHQQQQEKKEASQATIEYNQLFEQILTLFAQHRKKAKVVFIDDPAAIQKLKLKGPFPRSKKLIFEHLYAFYNTLDNETALAQALAQLKITQQQIQQQNQNLQQLQNLSDTLTREQGESQQATKDKDEAFEKLEQWVRKFHSIAKIALEDTPQLLESIAKFVRS